MYPHSTNLIREEWIGVVGTVLLEITLICAGIIVCKILAINLGEKCVGAAYEHELGLREH